MAKFTTQEFTEVTNISGNVIVFKNNNACSLIEASSINFHLLGAEEQDAKIYSYMAFLNSLNFPVQIFLTSKKVSLSSYITMLEEKIKAAADSFIKTNLSSYKEFIQHLTKDEVHLDKRIYIVVPFSPLEMGTTASARRAVGGQADSELLLFAKNSLESKAKLVISQLQRVGISGRVLGGKQILNLFYELFNQNSLPPDFEEKNKISPPDIIAPRYVEIDFKNIKVDNKFHRTFFVTDYPRYVSPGWLSTLINYKETMNISMFIYPIGEADILENLRRKIGELEATIETDEEDGRESDPKVTTALEDALRLQDELAKGLEKLFQFGLYITLSADTIEDLNEKTKQLTSLLASNLIIAKQATLQMEDGFKTTLPMGNDRLFITRNMDTTTLASIFPFASYELSQPNGVLYGINTLNSSLVVIDRFSFENANEVVFGKSGSGKSFLVKLEVLRQIMLGTEILIIDPEEEYKTLSRALGGEYISFSSSSPVKINPFALNPDDQSEGQLGAKILSLHSLLKIMVKIESPVEEALLDRAIILTYKQKGITSNPESYKNTPPILEDLYNNLLSAKETGAKDLGFRLEKFIKGGFAGLFNQQTNYNVKKKLTVFSLKELEESLRPLGMYVVLDFIWNRVKSDLKKRILVVDEAWYLVKNSDSAAFLQGIIKRARKYFLGVTTLTQDIEDFLSSDYGKTILSNSSIQILLKQSPTALNKIGEVFLLSEGEKQFLLSAQVGEGLLFAGQNHVTTQFTSSESEYKLVTSKPEDILKMREEKASNENG